MNCPYFRWIDFLQSFSFRFDNDLNYDAGAPAPAEAAETIKYIYDARGRLVRVERTGTVNNGVTTDYTIDKADNRTNKTTTGSPNPPPP